MLNILRRCLVVLSAAAVCATVPLLSARQAAPRVPSVDDLLNVKTVGFARVSPDGKWVAYTVSETDFAQDAFVTQIWLADVASGRTFQVTRGDKGAGGPVWSPDSSWLSFTSTRIGDRNQIFAIRPDGGEAMQLTKAETAVGQFAWSRDGKTIAFVAADPAPPAAKDRRDGYADFEVVRREYTHSHLWTIDVASALASPAAGQRRTKGKDFTVGGVFLVARQRDHCVQRHRQSRSDPGRDVGHLSPLARRRSRAQDRLDAGTGQRAAVVARRHADRVLVGDGERSLLRARTRGSPWFRPTAARRAR